MYLGSKYRRRAERLMKKALKEIGGEWKTSHYKIYCHPQQREWILAHSYVGDRWCLISLERKLVVVDPWKDLRDWENDRRVENKMSLDVALEIVLRQEEIVRRLEKKALG